MFDTCDHFLSCAGPRVWGCSDGTVYRLEDTTDDVWILDYLAKRITVNSHERRAHAEDAFNALSPWKRECFRHELARNEVLPVYTEAALWRLMLRRCLRFLGAKPPAQAKRLGRYWEVARAAAIAHYPDTMKELYDA